MKRWRLLFLSLLCLVVTALMSQPISAAPAQSTVVIVQPGDSLTRLASRYGITIGQLAAANGLSWNSWLYAGQRLTIPTSVPLNPAPLPSGSTYVVRAGDTLMRIAAHHGVSVSQLATLNGLYWNSWVYVGQRLAIPGGQAAPAPSPAPSTPSGSDSVYVVRAGNTLFSIAKWNGTTVSAIQAANGLSSATIYVGQRLKIPGATTTPTQPPAPAPAPAPSPGTGGAKWIDVNLSQQRITAYAGQTPVYSAIVSTGLPGTPTVVGTFSIYVKYVSAPMSGPGYYLPNVPHTMYFYRGYSIHGAYWHNNFGTPMSHGCVNLSLPDARWFFNWAPVGTKGVSHY